MDSPADAITPVDGDLSCSPVTVNDSSAMATRRQKTIVHVDDGSIHGSPNLFDEEEIAQLASKIKTILVQESPRGRDFDETWKQINRREFSCESFVSVLLMCND